MDVQEQLCYIPCSFCNIVLAVSVPYNSLFDVVTVRCGHCTNMWRVNIGAAALLHHHQQGQVQQDASALIATATLVNHNNINNNNVQGGNQRSSEYKVDLGSSSKWNNNNKLGVNYSITNKPKQRTVNQPPEKRQRVPSAYNQFIKEEIQRIKTNNPDIAHREAFSTAAKNWAHFPHIHFGLMLQTNNRV